ncbi:MAG: hypothetical protein ACK5QT_03540 [Oligoflexia bacterium]
MRSFALNQLPKKAASSSLAESFGRLNGEHRFKDANPGAFVEYSARKRTGGKVFYFNFPLARQMGLIPESHPDRITAELANAVLETFSLVIINEWDLEKGTRFRHRDLKPGKYMATRYLQLQHPSKTGKTSGDGRGIWNGEITHRGVTWDVMSSGTGATRLSPATAIEGRYFKSGDPRVCYGNGFNSIDDGLAAALMSEVFHSEGISTERTLALIVFPGGSSINVRAAPNLMRPSHLFCHLKQGNLQALKNAVHYCMERERRNGRLELAKGWELRSPDQVKQAVERFCAQVAQDFAKAAARYESDYVFCWMDWDGDNILMDGGIIDYGSIRRFGGFHAGYRYDDGDRYSTSLAEQKGRARYIVQTFAQIQGFLSTGFKRPISDFYHSRLTRIFDECFESEVRRRLLKKSGLSDSQLARWMSGTSASDARRITRYLRAFQRLERLQCRHGTRKVPDGLTTDAVFVMPRFLVNYPALWNGSETLVGPERLSQTCRSKFAKKIDLQAVASEGGLWSELERSYRDLAQATARAQGVSVQRVLVEWRMRSSVRVKDPPVTGDGILGVMEVLLALPRDGAQQEISRFLAQCTGRAGSTSPTGIRSSAVIRALGELEEAKEGI